jgi:hypothetical protein
MMPSKEWIKKEMEALTKDWFLGNISDKSLLNFVLNYGLKDELKVIEEKSREKYGKVV